MGLVTYTSVDNGNLDPLARNSLCPQLINLRHDMRRKRIRISIIDGPPLLGDGKLRLRAANPLNFRLGNTVDLDGPDLLDGRQSRDPGRLVLGILDVVELHRDALEELVVEVHAGVGVVDGGGFHDARGILTIELDHHNRGKVICNLTYMFTLAVEFNDVGTWHNRDFTPWQIARPKGRRSSRHQRDEQTRTHHDELITFEKVYKYI